MHTMCMRWIRVMLTPSKLAGGLSMELMRWREAGFRGWLRCLLLVLATAGLSACDPTIFKKPAQDFVAELRTLRDGYFGLLKLRRDAQYERTFSQQRQAYWAKPALA